MIGRRSLPRATLRNRIKRVVREQFRRVAEGLGEVDLLVRLRCKLAAGEMAAAEAELQNLLYNLSKCDGCSAC